MIIDIINTIPYSLFKHKDNPPKDTDFENLITFNLAYVPSAYIIFIGFKLIRLTKAKSSLRKFLKWIGIGVDLTKILITLWTIIIILHLIACFWGATATFNLNSNQNWIYEIGIEDESNVYKYITCLYWACMTAMTVGYGDILPVNDVEKLYTCVIFVIGVAMFSYTLSSLGSQFF